MTCRHCGKPVGLLRRLKGSPYCSDAHAKAEEINPASLVLQTLFKRDAVPASPKAPAQPAPKAPEQHEEHSEQVLHALLSALGQEDPAATDHPPLLAEEPDPPVANFLWEYPELQACASRHSRFGWIPPSWPELTFAETTGRCTVTRSLQSQLLEEADGVPVERAPEPIISRQAPDQPSEAGSDPPFAGFVTDPVSVSGGYTALSDPEPLRQRSGRRPSFEQIQTTCRPVADFHTPRPTAKTSVPQTQTGSVMTSVEPEANPQDSLVRLLVELGSE